MKRSVWIIMMLLVYSGVCQAQHPVQYILLEEFSTAPCGFCPDGDIIATKISGDYQHVIWVTHHAGFGTDSMTAPNSIPIAKDMTTFAPAACINRMDIPIPVYTKPPFIAISRQKWDSVIGAHLNDTALAEVELVNDFDSTKKLLTAKVNVVFDGVPAQGDMRINLFVVEDSVVGYGKGYDQKNYYNNSSGHPMYGRGDPVVGYVHHRVVRSIPTGAWGVKGIIPSIPEVQKKYTYTVKDVPIELGWKEHDIDIVAFISYYDADTHKRQILNATHKMMLDRSTGDNHSAGRMPVGLKVVPSPVNGNFRVEMQTQTQLPGRLEVLDASGKLMWSTHYQGTHTVMLNVQSIHLLPGIYFVRLMTGDCRVGYTKLVVTGR